MPQLSLYAVTGGIGCSVGGTRIRHHGNVTKRTQRQYRYIAIGSPETLNAALARKQVPFFANCADFRQTISMFLKAASIECETDHVSVGCNYFGQLLGSCYRCIQFLCYRWKFSNYSLR